MNRSDRPKRRPRKPRHGRLIPMEAFSPRVKKARWEYKPHFRRYHHYQIKRRRGSSIWTCVNFADLFIECPETGRWLPLTRRIHRQRGS